jgi:hypothetical protein
MQCGAIFYAAVANYCWRFVGIGRCLIAVGYHIRTVRFVRTGPRSR